MVQQRSSGVNNRDDFLLMGLRRKQQLPFILSLEQQELPFILSFIIAAQACSRQQGKEQGRTQPTTTTTLGFYLVPLQIGRVGTTTEGLLSSCSFIGRVALVFPSLVNQGKGNHAIKLVSFVRKVKDLTLKIGGFNTRGRLGVGIVTSFIPNRKGKAPPYLTLQTLAHILIRSLWLSKYHDSFYYQCPSLLITSGGNYSESGVATSNLGMETTSDSCLVYSPGLLAFIPGLRFSYQQVNSKRSGSTQSTTRSDKIVVFIFKI